MKAVVGHRFTLDMGQWGKQPCEITAVDPERLLEYHFAEGVLDTTITWRLEPEDEGTRLYLVHAGFDLDSPPGRAGVRGHGQRLAARVLNNVQRVLDAEEARSAKGLLTTQDPGRVPEGTARCRRRPRNSVRRGRPRRNRGLRRRPGWRAGDVQPLR